MAERASHVVIVGCNRTGTSLVRQILNASPQVCVSPETHFLRRLAPPGGGGTLSRLGPLSDDRTIRGLVDYLYAEHPRMRISYWQWLRKQVEREAFGRVLLEAERSERGLFAAMMDFYARRSRGGADDVVLGEKTPTHLYSVPVLLEWYPDARVIHTFRDLRAVIVSKRRKLAKAATRDGLAKLLPVPASILAPIALPIELGHTTRAWLDAAQLHWAYQAAYPGRYLLVRFEDLVADPETQTMRMCDGLGVPYERSMLADIHVAASGFQPRHRGPGGFDAAAPDRWRENINPLLERALSIVGRRQLRRFGYAP